MTLKTASRVNVVNIGVNIAIRRTRSKLLKVKAWVNMVNVVNIVKDLLRLSISTSPPAS